MSRAKGTAAGPPGSARWTGHASLSVPSLLAMVALAIALGGCGTSAADDGAETQPRSPTRTAAQAGDQPADDGKGTSTGTTASTVSQPSDETIQTGSVTSIDDYQAGVDSSGSVQSSTGEESETGRIAAGRAAVVAFAEAISANTVLARLSDGMAVLWNRGSMVDLPVGEGHQLRSDGAFVYRLVGDGGRTTLSTASTLDGTVVCRADDPIQYVSRGEDGSYVMAVEADIVAQRELDEIGGQGVPLLAVDCQTGDRQAIEPVTIDAGEAGRRIIERIGDREFMAVRDAEGNGDVLNEAGLAINGDAYAGPYAFNPDGSIMAYGDMDGGAGPHFTPLLKAADTSTGDRLWSVRFAASFQSFGFVDDSVVVWFPENEMSLLEGSAVPARAVVLDAVSGVQRREVEVGFKLLFTG